MESSRTCPWPRGSSMTLLTVLVFDTCFLDFTAATASDNDGVFALSQPLCELVTSSAEVYVILQNVSTVFWI